MRPLLHKKQWRCSGRFSDRPEAGRALAQALAGYSDENPVILALPRGGVPVAYQIARALHAPMEIFVVRKLGAPGHEELGIGAITQGGLKVLNTNLIRQLGVSAEQLQAIEEKETRVIQTRLAQYQLRDKAPAITGKTAIVVDDGLATGVTAKAALEALRQLSPKKLILAVPVGSIQAVAMLKPLADELVCLSTPENFMAVGQWYQRFEQTSDEEVLRLLKG